MNSNLGHPDNAEKNQLAQCQRVAALWVNQLSIAKITRSKIESNISQYIPEEQKIIRYWLNYYVAQSRQIAKPRKPKLKQKYQSRSLWGQR